MNWSAGALAADVWPSTVAVTSTVPEPGGAVAVQVVVEEQETSLAGSAPKSITVAPAVVEKPVPVMVVTVPPASNPVVGERPVTVGVAPLDP